MPGHQPIQSIQRALSILYAVAGVDHGLTPRQIAAAVGLETQTVYKMLHTLEREGLVVRQTKPLRYSLGSAISDLHHLDEQRRLLSASTKAFYKASASIDRGDLYLVEFIEGVGHTRLRGHSNYPTRIHRPRNYVVALPYYRASTLLYLAFASPTQRQAFLEQHPFEPEGLALWRSFSRYQDAVAKTRRNRIAIVEAPRDPNSNQYFYKVAAPVLDKDNTLLSAVGLSMRINEAHGRRQSMRRICQAAAKEITDQLGRMAQEGAT